MSEQYTKSFVGKRQAINPTEHNLLSPVYAVSKRLEANQRILMNLMGQLYTGGINQETLKQLRDISDDLSCDTDQLLEVTYNLSRQCDSYPETIPTTDQIVELKKIIRDMQRPHFDSATVMRGVGKITIADIKTYPKMYDNDMIETWNSAKLIGHVTRRNGHREMSGFGAVHRNGRDLYRASCSPVTLASPVPLGTIVFGIDGQKYTFRGFDRRNVIQLDTMRNERVCADGKRPTSKMYEHPPFFLNAADAEKMKLS